MRRESTPIVLIRTLVAVAGGLAIVTAVFADTLGLDPNSSWGPSRRLLLGVGLALAAGPFLRPTARVLRRGFRSFLWDPLLAPPARWVKGATEPALDLLNKRLRLPIANALRRIIARLRRFPGLAFIVNSPLRMAVAATALILLAALIFDIWLTTTGYWTRWPQTTSHFSLLAEGFLRGQLHLPIDPSPELLAAEDPYAEAARRFMPPVWDITYYEGKFFLYWGPVPALLLTLPRSLLGQTIGDWVLVLFFTAGISVVGSVLVLRLWSSLRRVLPWWLVVPGVAVLAFGNPLPWLLSRPSVYEAATATGQFFFLLGLLLSMPTLIEGRPRRASLFGAGASWGLAVGSRITLLPAVFVLCAGLSVYVLWTGRDNWRYDSGAILNLLGPLILCGILLSWYNWARFGDILEFGHRFQLGRANKLEYYKSTVSFANLIPNLYNYFFNPPNTLSIFPYLKPGWGAYYIWPAHYSAPENYYTERLTGLFITTPYLWLIPIGLFAAVRAGVRSWFGRPAQGGQGSLVRITLPGLTVCFAVISASIFAPISLFIAVSMRHLVDVAPVFTILAALAFWSAYEHLYAENGKRRILVLSAFVLALLSALASVLLAMTGFEARFERLNPELFQSLTRWFTF